jgi:hypothetical protein
MLSFGLEWTMEMGGVVVELQLLTPELSEQLINTGFIF